MTNQSDLFPDSVPDLIEGKKCIKCDVVKPLEHFTYASGANFRRPECKQCTNELGKVRKMLREKYGDPPEGYQCPICTKTADEVDRKGGKAGAFVIDHCHDTDTFRGWLCHNCNRGVGLMNDDVEMLQKAIDYLKRTAYHSNGT